MAFFPASLENLVDKFAALPGIGRKSAQRLAFYVLGQSDAEAQSFADAILDAKRNVHCCRICQNLTEGEICSVCASDSRDRYMAVASPSVSGLVAMMTSSTSSSATRVKSSLMRISSGPTWLMGLSTPCRT